MIDSHAHVSFEQFDEDREAVIARAREAGVTGWIEVGTDIEQSRKAIALAQQHENVWATVGVHPSDIEADGMKQETWKGIERLLEAPKVVAVGEVGLDFYRGGKAEEQLPILEKFVHMAVEKDLPVIFHVRSSAEIDANAAMIDFLSSLPDEKRPRGVMHTFSGNQQQAEAYLDLGMYLSFSGVLTFKNAGALTEIAKTVPLSRILIETDCPFLAPDPHRGARNEPAYVRLVAERLATLRDISVDEVNVATENTTRALFKL